MPRTIPIALIACAAALALAPGASAQELNPPAPDFYTCHEGGAGRTTCTVSRVLVNEPAPTDIECGTGADAFQVWDQGVIHQRAIRIYDADGNLVKRIIHERWTETQWSNPETGGFVPYTQMTNMIDVFTIPGDLSSAIHTETGENIYRDPATHRVVLHVSGRTVFSPEGELLSSSGSQPFLEYFLEDDRSAFEALCAVLASPPPA